MKIWYKIEAEIDPQNLPYPFDEIEDFEDWFNNSNEVVDLIKCCDYSKDVGHD